MFYFASAALTTLRHHTNTASAAMTSLSFGKYMRIWDSFTLELRTSSFYLIVPYSYMQPVEEDLLSMVGECVCYNFASKYISSIYNRTIRTQLHSAIGLYIIPDLLAIIDNYCTKIDAVDVEPMLSSTYCHCRWGRTSYMDTDRIYEELGLQEEEKSQRKQDIPCSCLVDKAKRSIRAVQLLSRRKRTSSYR